MLKATRELRHLLRRTGFDVVRYPAQRYEHQRQRILQRRSVETVIDVGANLGQYGLDLRKHGFHGKILSFEPLSAPFAQLSAVAHADRDWCVRQVAVGAVAGQVTLNVAGNKGASSSVLPMLSAHQEAAPAANYVGTEVAEQITLDSLPQEEWRERPFHVKIDVQGYEKYVLDGALKTLSQASSVEIELSFVPLYRGGMLIGETLDLLRSLNYAIAAIDPGFRNDKTDVLLQADGLFVRV